MPFVPYPLTSGGHQGSFNGMAMLDGTASAYLLVDCTESQYKRGEHKLIESALPFVHAIPYIQPESRHTLKWYLRAIGNKLGLLGKYKDNSNEQVSDSNLDLLHEPIRTFSKDKLAFINKCIQKYNIDIVQSEYFECISLVDYLPSNVDKYFLHHELRYVRDELLLKQCKNATEEDKPLLKNRKEKEIALLNKYDVVITVSSIDAEKLKQDGVNTKIVPSFSVVSDSIKCDRIFPVEKTISFVGPEGHYPNYDGVIWFLENCWERLLQKDSEYYFKIVGKWSEETKRVLSEKYKNVRFLGFVENLGEAIGGSTMVVPIKIGSGIRMKILEAARLNVPVVSTVIGAEGLPLENGMHAFITDDVEQFVDDIIKLQDESLRNKFVDSTNELISDRYSFDAIKKSRLFIYR